MKTIKLYYLLFVMLFLFIGCGSGSYIKTDTNPFFKTIEKNHYKIYVIIPFEATIEDKKAAKKLMDVISAYKNCTLTENVREADLFILILASSKTYTQGTSSGYTFRFPSLNQYVMNDNEYIKELVMFVFSAEKLPGRTLVFNNIVWTGLMRVPRENYNSHPKTLVHALFSQFGGPDIDSNVDIMYSSYME
jgi:hypothetical protein